MVEIKSGHSYYWILSQDMIFHVNTGSLNSQDMISQGSSYFSEKFISPAVFLQCPKLKKICTNVQAQIWTHIFWVFVADATKCYEFYSDNSTIIFGTQRIMFFTSKVFCNACVMVYIIKLVMNEKTAWNGLKFPISVPVVSSSLKLIMKKWKNSLKFTKT